MKMWVKRQHELCEARIGRKDSWFFSACYRGIKRLIGRKLAPGEEVTFEVTATNVVTTNVRRIPMQYLFSSKKSSQMGLPLAFFAAVGGYYALQQGISDIVVGAYYIMMGLVVMGHMIAYGLSDAAASGKKGK